MREIARTFGLGRARAHPGLGVGIDLDAIPTSLALAGGGVAVAYLAGLLPKPYGTVATIGGLGLLGGAILNLLDFEAAAGEGKVESPFCPGQSVEDLKLLSGRFTYPTEGGIASVPLFRTSYPIEFELTNWSRKPFCVAAVVRILEWGWFGNVAEQKIRKNRITIPPGETVHVRDLRADVLTIPADRAAAVLIIEGSAEPGGTFNLRMVNYRIT